MKLISCVTSAAFNDDVVSSLNFQAQHAHRGGLFCITLWAFEYVSMMQIYERNAAACVE